MMRWDDHYGKGNGFDSAGLHCDFELLNYVSIYLARTGRMRLVALMFFIVLECASIPAAHACGNWYELWIDCLVQKGEQRVIPPEYQNPGGQSASNPTPSADQKAVDRAQSKMLEKSGPGHAVQAVCNFQLFQQCRSNRQGLFYRQMRYRNPKCG